MTSPWSQLKKSVARKIGDAVPAPLGRLPYSLALHTSQLALRSLPGYARPLLWPRNSFVLGTLKPFVSDLDLTLWFENEPHPLALKKTSALLRAVARAFPFLGESNLYVSDEAIRFSLLLNEFERARDPELARRLPERGFLDRKAQASAFIFRMLEGDIHNVINNPESRRSKWNSHFEAVSAVASHAPPPLWQNWPERSLLRGIIEMGVFVLELAPAEEAIASLERYFEAAGRGVPQHTLDADRWLWAVLPHRFCFGKNRPPKLKDRAAEIFMAQIAWELWGILSQFRLRPDHSGAIRHVEVLTEAVRAALQEPRQLQELANSMLVTLRRIE